jgi:hypothetical protein
MPEGHVHAPVGYWGAQLFCEDLRTDSNKIRGSFSTGVIGARSSAVMLESFRAVIETTARWCFANKTRTPPVYDQPLANYVFNGLDSHDIVLFQSFLRSQLGSLEESVDITQRYGLVHFAGGVVNSSPKLAAMDRYLIALGETTIGQQSHVTDGSPPHSAEPQDPALASGSIRSATGDCYESRQDQ